jgi:hypothetical protein
MGLLENDCEPKAMCLNQWSEGVMIKYTVESFEAADARVASDAELDRYYSGAMYKGDMGLATAVLRERAIRGFRVEAAVAFG